MDFAKQACLAKNSAQDPNHIFILIGLCLIALLISTNIIAYFRLSKLWKKLIFSFISLIAFSIFGLVFVVILIFTQSNSFYGDQYFPLNAAIKNTCFLDPNKVHCPQTVEDLINIEPEHFKNLTRNAHLTYKYYPDTNQYTLIVRGGDQDAIIFDPRLKGLNYQGYVREDLAQVEVLTCNGKHWIKDPPPFMGPWDYIN